MNGRKHWLVCYDISNQRRWRGVYGMMRAYGKPLQYSVFHCILSPRDKAVLTTRLLECIHAREDRVLMIPLGSDDGKALNGMEMLGRQHQIEPQESIVV